MAWDNPPVRISERGAATQPRYIYVSSLSKGYLVYSGVRSAQHTFFVKEYPGSLDTWAIPADVGLIDYFDISESEVDDIVLIAYSHKNRIYKLEVNFATREVVSGPSFAFVGSSPAFDGLKPSRIDYIKNDDLTFRASMEGSEYKVDETKDRLFLQLAANINKLTNTKIRFASQMILSQEIALPFSNISGTILRYDGQTILTGPRRLEDLSVNSFHLPIDVLLIHEDYGLLYDGSYVPYVTWAVPSSALTIEAWVIPRMSSKFSYIIGGNDIRFYFKNDGTIVFEFTGIDTHVMAQNYSDIVVQTDQKMHISLSHTWGSPENTKLMINGTVVSSSWITEIGGFISSFAYVNPTTTRITTSTSHGLSNGAYVRVADTSNYNGTYVISNVTSNTFDISFIFVGTETGHWYAKGGQENPGFTNITSSIILSPGEYLHSMRILNVARTAAQVRDYIDGKIL